MKRIRYELIILLVAFIMLAGLRLHFAFQTENFSSDRAYFNLRQIESIRETGLPIYNDELSYSGRQNLFLPLFHYLIALSSLVFPYTAKIIPNLLACTIIFAVYLISMKITNDRLISSMIGVASGLAPIFFSTTINSVSIYSLIIPLAFFLVYLFMSLNMKMHRAFFIAVFAVMLLTHPSLLIIVLSFLVYLIFTKIEKLKENRDEVEIILFSFFVCVWFLMIFYKKIILFHGIEFFWQNIPSQIFDNYFTEISFLAIVNQIGILPFIIGIFVIYQYAFRKKNRNVYVLISIAITLLAMITFRMITLEDGSIFLSIVMILLTGVFLKDLMDYVKKTKFERFSKLMMASFLIVLLFTLTIPALIYAQDNIRQAFSEHEVNALLWIKENTPEDAVVVSFPGQGNFITFVAERRNVVDSNYFLIRDIDQRYNDVNRIYETRSVIEAIDLLNKYDAKYIYFSTDRLIENYRIAEINYLDDKCFVPAYARHKVLVYELKCTIKEQ